MTYPTNLKTVTLTFGRSISLDGTELPTKLTITPTFTGTKAITWSADGTALIPSTVMIGTEAGAMGSIQLPVTDQPGWVDDGQNPFSGWSYKITESVGNTTNRIKYLTPVMGQTVIDFDLIPDGSVGIPTVGSTPAVTSVNGQSGAVTIPSVTVHTGSDGIHVLTFSS